MAISMKQWLNRNTFKVHLTAFLLMTIPAALLYPSGANGAVGWIWVLLVLVITGNFLVLLVR